MCVVIKLIQFLQTNCKGDMSLYAKDRHKNRFAINSIKQLNNDEVVLFYDKNNKTLIPTMKVQDAILELQKCDEDDLLFYHYNGKCGNTKYYIIPSFSEIQSNCVYLFIDN